MTTKNNNIIQKLLEIVERNEKNYINEGLLYFNTLEHIEDQDFVSFFKKFLNEYNVFYSTYNAKNKEYQCKSGAYRSTEDIFRLSKNYFPQITFLEVIKNLVDLNEKKEIITLWCPDIEKRVWSKLWYEDYLRKPENGSMSTYDKNYISRFQNKTDDLNYDDLKIIWQYLNSPEIKKKEKMFKFQIYTRHPSYQTLRAELKKMPFKTVARFGSTTNIDPLKIKNTKLVEINTVEAVSNSASKLKMMTKFLENDISTAAWFICNKSENDLQFYMCNNQTQEDKINIEDIKYPLIIKSHLGSRGIGNYYIKDKESLLKFCNNRDMNKYIIQEYKTYSREYRLHINALENTCFYTNRKMLKRDAPEETRFQKHANNCVWILEENELFEKPINWDKIVQECSNALKAVGLDIGAVDVLVQAGKNKNGTINSDPRFIIIETSSAPSMGSITTEKYLKELPKIAEKKYQLLNQI